MESDEMRESFVLYRKQRRPIQKLNMKQRGQLFTAIMDYAEDVDPEFDDEAVEMAFEFFRIQLDLDAEKYEEIIEKRKAAGRAGAAATNQKRQMPANADTCRQMPAKVGTARHNENENENVDENGDEDESAPAAQAWAPPSIQQVQTFITENGLKHVRAGEFVEFYTARKWMAGKTRINWQQKILEWETNATSTMTSADLARRKEAERKKNGFHNFDERKEDLSGFEVEVMKKMIENDRRNSDED